MTVSTLLLAFLAAQATPAGAGAAPGWRSQAEEVVRADLQATWACGDAVQATARNGAAARQAMAALVPRSRVEIDAALSSQEPQAREAALAALSSVEPTEAELTAVVAAIVAPPSWMSRFIALGSAAREHARLGERERGAILRVLAAETNEVTRRQALAFLQVVPDAVAVPILVRWLTMGSPEGASWIHATLQTTMKGRLAPVQEALERQGSWEALRTLRELERPAKAK